MICHYVMLCERLRRRLQIEIFLDFLAHIGSICSLSYQIQKDHTTRVFTCSDFILHLRQPPQAAFVVPHLPVVFALARRVSGIQPCANDIIIAPTSTMSHFQRTSLFTSFRRSGATEESSEAPFGLDSSSLRSSE